MTAHSRSLARPWRVAHLQNRMNKLEADYATYLNNRIYAGELVSWQYETIKLQLAKRTWYTPDFKVITPTTIELHEVKGHWEDDARVKWKACAEKHPEFKFVAIQRKRGKWIEEVYGEDGAIERRQNSA